LAGEASFEVFISSFGLEGWESPDLTGEGVGFEGEGVGREGFEGMEEEVEEGTEEGTEEGDSSESAQLGSLSVVG